jgi:hypothetical protein
MHRGEKDYFRTCTFCRAAAAQFVARAFSGDHHF